MLSLQLALRGVWSLPTRILTGIDRPRTTTILTELALTRRKSGGRPSRDEAALKAERLLDAATSLFLRNGYGATSLEAVARVAGVSKRTLYARFSGKDVLLREVVARLVAGWLPPFDAAFEQADTVPERLLHAAVSILSAALEPKAIALHRLVVAEATRFPELDRILHEAGVGIAQQRLAGLLDSAGVADPFWAAQQFMALVLHVPQRRMLISGSPPEPGALEAWARQSVDLFLHGARLNEVPARD